MIQTPSIGPQTIRKTFFLHETMIIKELKILQNFCKNYLLANLILENNKNLNIIFIQESTWLVIRTIPSLISEEGKEVIGTPNHLSWIMFVKYSSNSNEHLTVLIYINLRLTHLYFSLRKDLINYKNINLICFFNCDIIYFIINIYSDN